MSKEVESAWVRYVREHYDPDPKAALAYADEADLLCLLNAPEQYAVEEEMLAYAKEHPSATMKELCAYFDKIA